MAFSLGFQGQVNSGALQNPLIGGRWDQKASLGWVGNRNDLSINLANSSETILEVENTAKQKTSSEKNWVDRFKT
jgi:hypothetical protein